MFVKKEIPSAFREGAATFHIPLSAMSLREPLISVKAITA